MQQQTSELILLIYYAMVNTAHVQIIKGAHVVLYGTDDILHSTVNAYIF